MAAIKYGVGLVAIPLIKAYILICSNGSHQLYILPLTFNLGFSEKASNLLMLPRSGVHAIPLSSHDVAVLK
jgi:hypothetical protein